MGMQVERLRRQREVLVGVAERSEAFDLLRWADVYLNDDGAACGTAACAVGWAALDSVLHAEGLHLVTDSFSGGGGVVVRDLAHLQEVLRDDPGCFVEPGFGRERGVWAAQEFFGIDAVTANRLFMGTAYRWKDRRNPRAVIARLVMLLAGEGLTMEWSARMAALELHHGFAASAGTDAVFRYFAQHLQAAYERGQADALGVPQEPEARKEPPAEEPQAAPDCAHLLKLLDEATASARAAAGVAVELARDGVLRVEDAKRVLQARSGVAVARAMTRIATGQATPENWRDEVREHLSRDEVLDRIGR